MLQLEVNLENGSNSYCFLKMSIWFILMFSKGFAFSGQSSNRL